MKIHISKNGQNIGQFELSEVNRMLQTGQISSNDLAWHLGMEGWVTLDNFIKSKSTISPFVSPNDALSEFYSPDKRKISFAVGNAGFFGFCKFEYLNGNIFNMDQINIFNKLAKAINRNDFCIFLTNQNPSRDAELMYVVAEPCLNYVASFNPELNGKFYSLVYTHIEEYDFNMDNKIEMEVKSGNLFEAVCFSLIECNLF